MRKVTTARKAKGNLPQDGSISAGAVPATAARALVQAGVRPVGPPGSKPGARTWKEPVVPDHEFKWTPGGDPKTPAEIGRFFRSPAIQTLKERICEMGRRLWVRSYVDGNGGNITVRVGDNLVLCTPTLISKGFMTPGDICLIDLDGRQLAGARKRTSEAMTHLAIMKRQPGAKSCVHAHPPHATAFAVAAVRPPTRLVPEAEIFLGEIGYARYETPGTPAVAGVVAAAAVDHCSVIMENHGVIVWGRDVEDAYWKMEITDSYCQVVWIASQLNGGKLRSIDAGKLKDLISLRKSLGMQDRRDG
jgi:L-fuculose-phosphate aldolase